MRQAPIPMRSQDKRDLRTQFAALCYRIKGGKPQFLLITSRRTGRWIIPKGWPVDGMTPPESALREAWEEAGVRGRATDRCIGLFVYRKASQDQRGGLPCAVMVYPVRVVTLEDAYPETHQRKRRWMGRRKAATKVSEPELARIIREFAPQQFKP